jgi:hypothetical protein
MRSPLEIIFGQLCLLEPLDVLEVRAIHVGRMEERVVPVLKFDAEVKREAASDLLECTNNAQPMFQITHVVVRHFKDEQGRWYRFHDFRFHNLCGSWLFSSPAVSGADAVETALWRWMRKPCHVSLSGIQDQGEKTSCLKSAVAAYRALNHWL